MIEINFKVCEFKLANLVNLKNAIEILEFSSEYEANQLKDFTSEFIVCNLITFIEANQLETVNSNLLKDLSKFYRSYFSLVESRIITPYSSGLDLNRIELIPLDLLYDQKFIDTWTEENTAAKRKGGTNRESFPGSGCDLSPVIHEAKKSELFPVDTSLIKKNLCSDSEGKETVVKWEKVKKKVKLYDYFYQLKVYKL